jgi:hypothetical protein
VVLFQVPGDGLRPGVESLGTGEARGSRRAAADLARCRDAGTPEVGMTGATGCTVTAASREDRAGRDADGSAADAVTEVMCARGISRPYRRLKHGLTTLASVFSPDGENTLPRVQAVADPGKMRVSVWARRDLNPHTGEISPIPCLSTQIW